MVTARVDNARRNINGQEIRVFEMDESRRPDGDDDEVLSGSSGERL